jgi:Xaa-Pro dipeptidase
MISLCISSTEYEARSERLLEYLRKEKLTGVVLFDQYYVLYYTGFAFIPTERPIAFVMNVSGERALFVPRLEVEHAKSNSLITRVDYYVEYPLDTHPMNILQKMLSEMGVKGNIGVDHDGYPWILGYRGPSLTELTGGFPSFMIGFIEDQMMIKSPAEVGLICESIKWSNLAHTLLQRYTRVGVTETYASMRAGMEATLAMLDAIGPIYSAQSAFSDGPSAGYRGQIGRNASIPHSLANNILFQPGDVLVSGASTPMWGYNSELERTMILGNATSDQKNMFDHMIALQDTAFKAIRPGVLCSEVDKTVRVYFETQDLMPYWRHHTGHAIGLRYHEGPFLDIGDHTPIQKGMVFTVEPGLYSPKLGGFRHSDTVVVTQEGIEILTYYPRDLSNLTVPV